MKRMSIMAVFSGLLLTAAACASVDPANPAAVAPAAGDDCHPEPPGGAAGPYAAFRALDQLVFVSGQIGVDPAAAEAAPGFESQMKLALTRLEMALSAAGSSPAEVLKATVYLADPADMAAMNRLYRDFFESRGAPLPARSLVPGLDFGNAIAVEIDVIARRAPCG